MSQAVTKCPKCETTFRVSEAQLQVAKGKVRCGSCLHVFKAADHWVTPPTAPRTAAKEPPVAGKTAAGKFQFDQAAIDSSSADKVLTKPAMPAVNTLGEMRPAALRAASPRDEGQGLIQDEDEEVKITDTNEAPAIAEDDYSDLFLNLDDLGEGGADRFNTEMDLDAIDDESVLGQNRKSKAEESADESWAKDLLEEVEDNSKQKEAQLKKIFNAGIKDNVFADDGHVKKKEEARDGFISGNRFDSVQDTGLHNPPVPPPSPLNRKELLAKIEPAPVEIAWSGSSRDWLGLLMWTSLTIVAALGLVVQYLWINFETLARDQHYRPMYARACETLGCTLPDLFNPAAIRSYNLVVRTDPQVASVLMVDAILQNDASYPQPFPDLELYFSDLDNFPVASRRFTSAEYLQGEMAGKTTMPPAKSIHVSLQIVDPGSKAVNYRLQISDHKPVNG